MILHRLDGCTPVPLAHYLKALGVLRLVAEQLDPEARGWWEGERFCLASRADEPALLDFLLNRYSPTPLLNPWGARSGFYQGSNERTSREVLELIENSPEKRFQSFRESIRGARDIVRAVTGGAKPGDDEDGGKADLVLAMKNQMRGPVTNWLNAVIAIVDTSRRQSEQPALLGTGGSEGSGSYTAAYMKALRDCLIEKKWNHALQSSLFDRAPTLNSDWPESFGQFIPCGVGGPWDLLLALEGACTLQSSVVTRSQTVGDRWMSSPFYLPPSAAGSAAAARLDEFALKNGKELPGRGEQWFPIWSAPTAFREIESLMQQGRAMVGRKRVASALQMSISIARLGVAKGIREFVRYGYLQRNNLATHFAVPLGRFVVPERASRSLACLEDLEAWLPRLRRAARDRDAPARLIQAETQLGTALFALTQHPDEASRWQWVLIQLARIEALQVHGAGKKAGPIPRLRPEWVEVADDGSSELRLGAAFALQRASSERFRLSTASDRDGVRRHWLSLEKGRYANTPSTDRVMEARSGIDDAIAVVLRRLIESAQRGDRRLPLEPGFALSASRHDLARLLAGEVDLDRCLALARALMALDVRQLERRPPRLQRAPPTDWPDDAWLAIRLACLPWPLPDGRKPGVDPAIVRRLQAGDLASALQLAQRRLRPAGIRTSLHAGSAAPGQARLYAAALAFPIDPRTAAQFAQRLDPTSAQENAA